MAKRTIRRRMRKSRTIRKVMRGCNRRGRGKVGGAPVQAFQAANGSPQGNQVLAAVQVEKQQADVYAANTPSDSPTPIGSNMAGGKVTTEAPVKEPFGVGGNISSTYAQVGGGYRRGRARTRHQKRKLRYKKSVARKSRRS
jgi:hypothetical protein